MHKLAKTPSSQFTKMSSDQVTKTESSQSAAQSPITSIGNYAGIKSGSSLREGESFGKVAESVRASGGRNFVEKREKDIEKKRGEDQLKKDLVNKYLLGQKGRGFEKFYQREMEAKKTTRRSDNERERQREED